MILRKKCIGFVGN